MKDKQKQGTQYCKQIVFADDYNSEGKPTNVRKLLGLCTDLGSFFLFKTKNKTYKINKSHIISISNTNIIFQGCDSDG